MSEGPKLYVNKPKKAQMKQFKGTEAPSSSSSLPSSSSASKLASPAISSYYSTGSSGGDGGAASSKPPQVPKESFARRYKFLWPLLLTVNIGVGAYLFMRTKKKGGAIEEETTIAATAPPSISTASPSASTTAAAVPASPPVEQPVKVLEPIPEPQQRELFKWILEEKRKIKTNDPEEKKRIEEEKAILKQFIRAKSIPSI